MQEDIANNIELMPILKGVIVSIVLIAFGMIIGNGFIGLFGVIIGAAFSGFSTYNSTSYALIYGAIVGIISSFLVLTVFTIPLFIILGLFGGFMGKVVQSKL